MTDRTERINTQWMTLLAMAFAAVMGWLTLMGIVPWPLELVQSLIKLLPF